MSWLRCGNCRWGSLQIWGRFMRRHWMRACWALKRWKLPLKWWSLTRRKWYISIVVLIGWVFQLVIDTQSPLRIWTRLFTHTCFVLLLVTNFECTTLSAVIFCLSHELPLMWKSNIKMDGMDLCSVCISNDMWWNYARNEWNVNRRRCSRLQWRWSQTQARTEMTEMMEITQMIEMNRNDPDQYSFSWKLLPFCFSTLEI